MFNFSKTELLIHGIGILGILLTVIGFQLKKHKYVIGFRTANELLFAFQYFLLGGYTGAAMNTIGAIRNMIFINSGVIPLLLSMGI